MITLYDIPSTTSAVSWSPNTRKSRYALSLKGIQYQTIWVEYPDIEATCKKIGAPPTSERPDGSLLYTVPVIHDDLTGAVVADSWSIAEYLDKTYPDTPKLFPPGTKGLQYAFVSNRAPLTVLGDFVRPHVPSILHSRSQVYFFETKLPPGHSRAIQTAKEGEENWAKIKTQVEEGFSMLNVWYGKEEGPFLMGAVVCFADIVLASYLLWMRTVLGEESMPWRDIKGWHNGRWDAIVNKLKEYETIG